MNKKLKPEVSGGDALSNMSGDDGNLKTLMCEEEY